jgi:hypothetical protein
MDPHRIAATHLAAYGLPRSNASSNGCTEYRIYKLTCCGSSLNMRCVHLPRAATEPPTTLTPILPHLTEVIRSRRSGDGQYTHIPSGPIELTGVSSTQDFIYGDDYEDEEHEDDDELAEDELEVETDDVGGDAEGFEEDEEDQEFDEPGNEEPQQEVEEDNVAFNVAEGNKDYAEEIDWTDDADPLQVYYSMDDS